MNSSDDELVCLKDGPAVPRAAVNLILALEDRGVVVRRDGAALKVGPRSLITDADRAAIKVHRDALLRLTEWLEA
jgi:hypothetical protein